MRKEIKEAIREITPNREVSPTDWGRHSPSSSASQIIKSGSTSYFPSQAKKAKNIRPSLCNRKESTPLLAHQYEESECSDFSQTMEKGSCQMRKTQLPPLCKHIPRKYITKSSPKIPYSTKEKEYPQPNFPAGSNRAFPKAGPDSCKIFGKLVKSKWESSARPKPDSLLSPRSIPWYLKKQKQLSYQ